jgi:hypothetical protein
MRSMPIFEIQIEERWGENSAAADVDVGVEVVSELLLEVGAGDRGEAESQWP